jgi:hypothetical protein
MSDQLMIPAAGPYRSGTNDDPVLIQRNVDAVLRIGGSSAGADDMVATGERLGKRIFRDLSEIPERRR